LRQANVTIYAGGRLKITRQTKTFRTGKGKTSASANLSAIRQFFTLTRNNKVKLDEIHTLIYQLAVLLESGVPLLSALSLLGEQNQNSKLKAILSEVHEAVRGGATLTQALAKYPETFPGLMLSMVKAAEVGGRLPDVLRQTAVYLEEQDKLDKKLKAATVYPRFVFFFFMTLMVGIIFGLIPKFEETFADFGMELPAPTRILMTVSRFAVDHILMEILLIVAGGIAYHRFKRSERGIYFFDKLKLAIPLMGEVTHKATLSKFCRTLRTLLSSGVSLVQALEIAGETAQNSLFTRAIEDVKCAVTGGSALAAALELQAVFPPMITKMVATGERAGSMEKMLKNVSDLYDTDVSSKIASITSVIEPVLMVALGFMAVVVILALYLPIFQMTSF